MINEDDKKFLRRAVALGREGVDAGHGGPFGAVIVRDGEIIGEGYNNVLRKNDPTAHAEVTAIRNACENIDNFQLDGATIYSSCEPCPMCLGAIYWARPDRLVFASSREDAADAGFDDAFIYEEVVLPVEKRRIVTLHKPVEEGKHLFEHWKQNFTEVEY